MNGELEFQYPWLLALLALLPVYVWLRGKVGRFSAVLFSSADIARAAGAQARSAAGRLLFFLRLLAVALGIVALAGPRWVDTRMERQAAGLDIILALDLSWSMMALDMGKEGQRVTRFDIAARVLEDFIKKRPDDRMGLVVFSAVPYVASPLTLNHDWLIENLHRLHIGMLRELGTAIGDAIAVAAKRLTAIPNSRSRIIILLTDGDNNKGNIDPLPAAQMAAALGVKIYTIGIGVDKECSLPAFDPATGKLTLDANGNIVPTLLLQPANYDMLGKIAMLSRANFYRATNARELQAIYNHINAQERHELKIRSAASYRPLFHWPLLGALGLLAVELLLANTRYRRTP
jgi:Ca-activated chloride channel family protein